MWLMLNTLHIFPGEGRWRGSKVPRRIAKGADFRRVQGREQMYPEIMVIPMREELTRAGIAEARSAADVDAALAQPGTTMVVVNSICGCAAGKMRPGVHLPMHHAAKPDRAQTVLAGQHREPAEKARRYV